MIIGVDTWSFIYNLSRSPWLQSKLRGGPCYVFPSCVLHARSMSPLHAADHFVVAPHGVRDFQQTDPRTTAQLVGGSGAGAWMKGDGVGCGPILDELGTRVGSRSTT